MDREPFRVQKISQFQKKEKADWRFRQKKKSPRTMTFQKEEEKLLRKQKGEGALAMCLARPPSKGEKRAR